MTDQPDKSAPPATAGVLSDVVSGFARLLRGELALARAEAKRSLHDATSALGKLAIAAVLGIAAVNALANAAISGLIALGWPQVWSSLAVGAALLVATIYGIQIGLAQLDPSKLSPKRMMANLRQDAEILKTMVTPDASSRHQP